MHIISIYIIITLTNFLDCRLTVFAVIPMSALLPKPFRIKLRLLLSFMLFVCFHKQACDAALKHKSLSQCDRLCREEGIRTLDTLPYTRFPSVLLQPLGHLSKNMNEPRFYWEGKNKGSALRNRIFFGHWQWLLPPPLAS